MQVPVIERCAPATCVLVVELDHRSREKVQLGDRNRAQNRHVHRQEPKKSSPVAAKETHGNLSKECRGETDVSLGEPDHLASPSVREVTNSNGSDSSGVTTRAKLGN